MESYPDRSVDPLLFLNTDKNDLDSFLLNTSADMARMAEELQASANDIKIENSLDIDSLEHGGHLGDMHWLHNSSLSTLTHLDAHNDDTSDGTNLISVDPQSVLPMQMVTDEVSDDKQATQLNSSKPRNFHSPDFANSAAMRLHANCSSLGDSPETVQQQRSQQGSTPLNVLHQEHETIRILSVASQNSPVHSPVKVGAQNFLITSSSPRASPQKAQTFVLSSASGAALPAGLTLTATTSNRVSSTGPSHFVISSPQKIQAIATDKSGRVLLKSGNNLLSPSQASPVLLGRLQTGIQPQLYQHLVTNANLAQVTAQQQRLLSAQNQHATTAAPDSTTVSSTTGSEDKVYPKPVFSYSCLIALALKNSKDGSLPVSEIYTFMCENFPYFKTAPDGWKNSVRHNLSLNKCFAKVDNPKLSQGAKKGCLWALNPAKISKMEDEISKWGKKDPVGLLSSMAYPENLEAIEKGQAGLHYSKSNSVQADSKLIAPIKSEAMTPSKTPLFPSTTSSSTASSPLVKHEAFSTAHSQPFRIEKLHPNIRVEKVEPRTPTKENYYHTVSSMEVSSPIQKAEVSSPALKSHALQSANIDLSQLELPASLNTDALADIVLQSTMWDEDLENNIDIDLICDSPTAGQQLVQHTNTQSPLTVRCPSVNSIGINQLQQQPQHQHMSFTHSTTGSSSPSVHSLYNHLVSSHSVQANSPSPTSVRSNLFGVSSSPLKPLYAS